jgi:hypothetical protein
MSYKELIYKNALEIIRQIYEESKYNPDIDLYRSLDIITATNDAQLASKEWLVDNLVPIITPGNINLHTGEEKYLHWFDDGIQDILVMGSWYSLTAILLRERIDSSIKIHNVDIDPISEIISYKLAKDLDHENTWSITADALDYFFERTDAFQLIINTSCEHMNAEDLRIVNHLKNPETIVCLQSNNFHSETTHINTYDTLEEFVNSLGLTTIYWQGELETDSCTRFMVIGI